MELQAAAHEPRRNITVIVVQPRKTEAHGRRLRALKTQEEEICLVFRQGHFNWAADVTRNWRQVKLERKRNHEGTKQQLQAGQQQQMAMELAKHYCVGSWDVTVQPHRLDASATDFRRAQGPEAKDINLERMSELASATRGKNHIEVHEHELTVPVRTNIA